MRILFVNTLYHPDIGGGAEVMLKAQAEALAGRGHEVMVLTIGEEPGSREELIDGVRVYRMSYRNIYFHHRPRRHGAVRRLKWHIIDSFCNPYQDMGEKIHEFRPDVISCHNLCGFGMHFLNTIYTTGYKTTITLHDQYLLCARSTMFKGAHVCSAQCIECKLLRCRYKKISSNLDGAIGVSQFILDKLTKAGYLDGVKNKIVIHNPPNAKAITLPEDLDGGTAPIVFGYLGLISESKGVRLLLEAFSKISADAHLVVAGTGDEAYVAELRKIYANNKVKFIGYVPPKEFYRQVESVIVPSIWEDTFPGVVLEALANNKTVIGSRRGGIPEMIIDDVNGILFNPRTPEELVAAINSYVDNRDRWTHTLKNSEDKYKWSTIDEWIDKLEEFYSRVVR